MLNVWGALPCEQGDECRNSPQQLGEERAKCHMCRLSPSVPAGLQPNSHHHWRPLDRRRRHPVLEAEKRAAARRKLRARQQARLDKDKARQATLRSARKAEQDTGKRFFQHTKNSGRAHRDGDHTVAGAIMLDTKHQSTRDNPVVSLIELHKVRMDALTHGRLLGALVLRPRGNQGVVAIDEGDFAKLMKRLQLETSDE